MSYIDDIMGFDPTSLEAFREPVSINSFDANVYKTNPVKLSKAEDGHYRARIRVIYNPFNPKKSIVKQETYFIQDSEGSLLVRSKLSNDDRECPIFKSWKKLWFSGDEVKKEWAKKMYDKTSSQWCLVQILEDENQPELVGKILAWKLPKSVFTKMSAKMNPSAESKKTPVPVMDYLMGLPLDLDVAPGPDDKNAPERKQREINYDLCEFDSDYSPIVKVDGTPLFDESELETIDNFVTARAELSKAKTTAAKKEAATKTIESLTETIKALYQKSLDYLKENSFDLVEECGYQEWDESTTTRVNNWINAVLAMQDPKAGTVAVTAPGTETATEMTDVSSPMMTMMEMPAAEDAKDDDLPF